LKTVGKQESYSFIKGHCGWDSVTLLFGEEVPKGEEHRIANTLLDPPCTSGFEIGFLYPPEKGEDIRLRIIDSTTRTWLPMCGGMSQVIGIATFQTQIHSQFKIEKKLPKTTIKIGTDSGIVPIDITFDGNQIRRVRSQMGEYIRFLYKEGVEPVDICGVPAMKVGYFLVFKLDDLNRLRPDVEFRHRGEGPGLRFLRTLQSEYLKMDGKEGSTLYSMIYDLNREEGGRANIYTRIFRGKDIPQQTLMEAQCGTGTIAVGLAMAERDEIEFQGQCARVIFEWGKSEFTVDPYGVRKSVLDLKRDGLRISWGAFSHSVVELQSSGTLHLPAFRDSLF
jgi:hypothetical protein